VDIVVKGRRTEVSDRFRQHVIEKLSKLEKLDGKLMSLDVEVSKERNPRLADRSERVEITCRTRGPVVRAEAAADDPYAALDLAYAKLEARMRKSADRRRVHHGMRTPTSVAAATAALRQGARGAGVGGARPAGAAGPAAGAGSVPGAGFGAETGSVWRAGSPAGTTDDAPGSDGGMTDSAGGDMPVADFAEGPLVVREKTHQAKPMSLDQALYEMELVGHDFYLFVDSESGLPSVVYRRRGYDYGVIHLAT
jgi:ribosomal subunit interface protein